jgi:RND family efflux transporter MFP subunit
MRFLWLLLSVALFAGCSEAPPEPVKPIPRVKTFLVGDKALGQLRRISGKLIAADSSVLSFALSGTIATVNVSSGDSVNKSQLLASLEKRPFELAVKNSRAQLNIARAKLNEKQKQYSRFKELFQEQVVSRSELEVAESELGTARGNLQSAQSTLETTTRDLKNTALIAPFSGRLAKRSIEPFQEISVGSEAFVLESAGSLQVEVLVPETLIRNVDHGQVVQVDFPTLKDSQVAGQVVEIGSQVQAGNAFPVKVQLTASNVDLRPGMSAAVLFNFDAYLENRTVYMIPLAAIAIEAGLISNYGKEISSGKRSKVPVYIFDENSSTVKLREIVVGELRGNSLEVFEGLEAGEQVVTAGVVFLRDNMQARRWDASQGLIE